MSDFLAIQALAYRYARAADRRDYSAFNNIFTEDAVLAMPGREILGREAIVQAMTALEQFKRTLHMMHNILVEFEGATASAEIYCIASHIYDREDGEYKQDWGIRYLDSLIETPEGWRITRRELIREWVQDLPLKKG